MGGDHVKKIKAGRLKRFFYENAQTYKCYPAIGGDSILGLK